MSDASTSSACKRPDLPLSCPGPPLTTSEKLRHDLMGLFNIKQDFQLLETWVLVPEGMSLKVRPSSEPLSILRKNGLTVLARSPYPDSGKEENNAVSEGNPGILEECVRIYATQRLEVGSKYLAFSGSVRADKLPLLPFLTPLDPRFRYGAYDEVGERCGIVVRFSNWVRYLKCTVQCSPLVNMIATKSRGSVVFEVIRDIQPSDEPFAYLIPDLATEPLFFPALQILRSSLQKRTHDSVLPDIPLDLSTSLLSSRTRYNDHCRREGKKEDSSVISDIKSTRHKSETQAELVSSDSKDGAEVIVVEEKKLCTQPNHKTKDIKVDEPHDWPSKSKSETLDAYGLGVDIRSYLKSHNACLKKTDSSASPCENELEYFKYPPLQPSLLFNPLSYTPYTALTQHKMWSPHPFLSTLSQFAFPLQRPPSLDGQEFHVGKFKNFLPEKNHSEAKPPLPVTFSLPKSSFSSLVDVSKKSRDSCSMIGIPPKRRERSMLPCSECGKTFDRPSLLKRHMRTHTGEKPHVCDVCGKGFSTSSSLNTHRRIHSGEKPHQCGVCGKRFTASSNLYYHKMTHIKEKPHKCTLCTRSFPTPGDLRSHMFVHNGQWPHKCAICGKGFSKLTNLKNHVALHSEKARQEGTPSGGSDMRLSSERLFPPMTPCQPKDTSLYPGTSFRCSDLGAQTSPLSGSVCSSPSSPSNETTFSVGAKQELDLGEGSPMVSEEEEMCGDSEKNS